MQDRTRDSDNETAPMPFDLSTGDKIGMQHENEIRVSNSVSTAAIDYVALPTGATPTPVVWRCIGFTNFADGQDYSPTLAYRRGL